MSVAPFVDFKWTRRGAVCDREVGGKGVNFKLNFPTQIHRRKKQSSTVNIIFSFP